MQGVGAKAGVACLHRQAAKKIGDSAASEEKYRQPERNHADDGEIGEVHVFDHAVAENVDLRADGSSHVTLAREMAVEGVQRDGGDGEDDAGEVEPGAVAEAEDGDEADEHAEEGDFVGGPNHEALRTPEQRRARRGPRGWRLSGWKNWG